MTLKSQTLSHFFLPKIIFKKGSLPGEKKKKMLSPESFTICYAQENTSAFWFIFSPGNSVTELDNERNFLIF